LKPSAGNGLPSRDCFGVIGEVYPFPRTGTTATTRLAWTGRFVNYVAVEIPRQDAMTAPTGSSFAQRLHASIVWGVWVAMLAGALGFVYSFCSDLPYGEEWYCVPQMTGARPLTFSFLWKQITDHRMPVNKLVFVLLGRWTNGELRFEMTLSVLLLASLAALLILTAKRLRGQTHFADAFFPLALLHWGHWEVFIMAFLFQFVASTGLAFVVFSVLVRQPVLSQRQSLLIALCLILLPLLGTNGLIFVPPIGCWLLWVAFRRWRSTVDGERKGARLLAGLVGLAAILCVLYGAGFHRPAGHPVSPNWRWTFRTCSQFLGMSLGSAGIWMWPHGARIVAVILLATLGRLAWLWRKDPDDRVRLAGLLSYFAAMAAMTMAVGWGRAGFGPFAGFAPRYALLALPILVAAYFTWTLNANRIARLVQVSLCMTMGTLLYLDTLDGMAHGEDRRELVAYLKKDLESGGTPLGLAQRHYVVLFPLGEITIPGLEMLQQAHMGPYRDVVAPKSVTERERIRK
jgi:hypothetical protein